jgi:hypothetical protein
MDELAATSKEIAFNADFSFLRRNSGRMESVGRYGLCPLRRRDRPCAAHVGGAGGAADALAAHRLAEYAGAGTLEAKFADGRLAVPGSHHCDLLTDQRRPGADRAAREFVHGVRFGAETRPPAPSRGVLRSEVIPAGTTT